VISPVFLGAIFGLDKASKFLVISDQMLVRGVLQVAVPDQLVFE